jgi:hypothetical protein
MFDCFGIELHQPYSHQAGLSCRAQAFLQKSLSLCTQVGDRWGMGTAYRNLGLTALAHGDADNAQALRCCWRIQNMEWVQKLQLWEAMRR